MKGNVNEVINCSNPDTVLFVYITRIICRWASTIFDGK